MSCWQVPKGAWATCDYICRLYLAVRIRTGSSWEPKEFKECRPFQMYQSSLGFPRQIWTAEGCRARGKPSEDWLTWNGLQSLNSLGRWVIEKAVFVTSASIFSQTVGGMKRKFGEEIEKNTFIKIRHHSGEIFSMFAFISVWCGGGLGWRPLSCKPCLPRRNHHRPKVISL